MNRDKLSAVFKSCGTVRVRNFFASSARSERYIAVAASFMACPSPVRVGPFRGARAPHRRNPRAVGGGDEGVDFLAFKASVFRRLEHRDRIGKREEAHCGLPLSYMSSRYISTQVAMKAAIAATSSAPRKSSTQSSAGSYSTRPTALSRECRARRLRPQHI